MNLDEINKFRIEQNLSRIVSLKNRLDVLMFSLGLTTVFAFFYQDCDFGHAEIFGLDIQHNDPYYHFSIAILLMVIFGLIGSHLIEYVNKRYTYDKLVSELKLQSSTVSETIPGSFYEFIYIVKKFSFKNILQELAILAIFTLFFTSHLIGFTHIISRLCIDTLWTILIGFLLILILISLYVGFISSMKQAKKKLAKQLKYRIWIFIPASTVIYLLLLIPNLDSIISQNNSEKNNTDKIKIELRINSTSETEGTYELNKKS